MSDSPVPRVRGEVRRVIQARERSFGLGHWGAIRVRRCAPRSGRWGEARIGWIGLAGVVRVAVRHLPYNLRVHEFRFSGAIRSDRAAAEVETSAFAAGQMSGRGVQSVCHFAGRTQRMLELMWVGAGRNGHNTRR